MQCEEKQLKNEREKWIDRCRGLAIILVLLGHTSPPFRKVIYGFHMPLFFILSGYIFYTYNKVWKLKSYIKKIAYSYLRPYFLFCVINYFITIGVNWATDRKKAVEYWKVYICGILYSRGTKEWMPNCSPLWFLTALFCTMIILSCVMKLQEKVQYFVVGLMLICSGGLAYIRCPKLPWNIDTALLATVFCYGGVLLARYKMISYFLRWNSFKKWLFLFVTMVVGVQFVFLNARIEEVNFNSCVYGNYFFMLIGAFGISIAMILFMMILQLYVDDEANGAIHHCYGIVDKYFLWLGRHTILIMAFDYQSMSVAVRITRKLLGEENWTIEFILKVLIISFVMAVWTKIIELLPSRLKHILNY